MAEVERVDANTIRFERVLDAPVETVWRYLIDGELRGRWFADGPAEERVGGEIALRFDHDLLSAEPSPYPERYRPYRGIVAREEIVRFEPPRLIAFTFEGKDKQSIATFELSALAEGRTRLVLTHNGIVAAEQAVDFAGGWHAHLAALALVVRGEQLSDFWAQHAASEALMRDALA
jgi:uncharacterized protein YndB with AHSA1/START domain